MSLITLDELARGATLLTFGSLAGLTASVWAPATAWWLLPAGCAALGGALTVPEVRQELQRALPLLEQARPLLPTPRRVGHWVQTGEWRQLPGPLPARRRPQAASAPWLHTLNDEPDRAPHAIVFGPSGAGKTTLARAFLGARDGAAVVLSPKIAADNWARAEVVTLDDAGTYAPIVVALEALEGEKRRRIGILRREGAQALTPLSIVLDEVPELTANVKQAGPFIVSLAGIGRELKMRLVCLSTSERVGALGIRGRGDTLSNFVRVDLDRERRGTLDDGVSVTPIGTPASWQRLAARSQLRPWHEPEPWPEREPATATTQNLRPLAPADDLLAALLAQPVSSASGSVSMSMPSPMDMDMDTGHGHGGVSNEATVVLPAGHGPTVIKLSAAATASSAPSSPAPPAASADLGARRRRGRGGYGLNAKRRRQLAGQRKLDGRKAELQAAYAARKAEGWSYNRAWRELGGNSDETRAWWRAAPGPAMKGHPDA